MPPGYDVSDWDISDLVCEEAPVIKSMISRNGRTYIGKFNRKDLVDVAPGLALTFMVRGLFHADGRQTQCKGSNIVRVLK